MTKKRDRRTSKPRLSPTSTLTHISDDFIEELDIPRLPEKIPERLEEAIRKRVNAYLYYLREARRDRYVPALEVRLLRDAHRAVLTAYELGLPDGEVFYASFRTLAEELGYERTAVGYGKRAED
jgi:hypothetical protein